MRAAIEGAKDVTRDRACGVGVALVVNGAAERGGADYLENYVGRRVETVNIQSNKLGSPEYASVLGLVDLIFDSIEQRIAEQETLPMRVVDTFKGLFGRSKSEDDE